MSKKLVDNIHLMSNPELIGLAKNRWLPADVQLAIAEHPYRRAHEYLCENDGLDRKTRDYLWSDACNRGYSLKTLLLTYGHYTQDPSKYEELYEKHPGAWSRSPWRMSRALLGGTQYWQSPKAENLGCPPRLLNRIYDEQFKPKLKGLGTSRYSSYYGISTYDVERLAMHPNADITLAIKLSTCGVDNVQKLAFKKIVELS
tara:strand:+ start:63163 stop:63765 length:603 start_codon:yes stop_codon:yes gene_type:complete